jgi:hypothetical protein
VSADVKVLALQRMLGHTSAKMTLDTYSDLFDDDLDAPKCGQFVGTGRKRELRPGFENACTSATA